MSVGLAKSIIDKIAEDLETNGGLAEHFTVKYRRPRAILPMQCPLLVVWLVRKQPTPLTTEMFDGNVIVGCSWHQATIDEAQQTPTGIAARNTETGEEMMAAIGKIEERMRYLAKNGIGLQECWEVLPGEVSYVSPEMSQGLTDGYEMAVICKVTE